jgi:hypothetical protein
MNLPPELVRNVDIETVSETFVDSFGMNSCDGKIVRIDLCVTRLDTIDPKHPPTKPSAKRYPACRLVMQVETLARLCDELQRLLTTVQQQSGRGTSSQGN